MIKNFIKAIGPIILSALSITLTFFLLQPLAIYLDPSFSLLSNRGVGKVAFVVIAIFQITLFMLTLGKKFLKQFLKTNIYFFQETIWIKKFISYFGVFFSLHAILLFILFLSGFAVYNPMWGEITISLTLRTLFGFIVVFFLAWTEELIFRGTLFPYFEQTLSTFSSLILTSTIFMFVHDLRNPLNLITINWKLGLGLFLLGMILNLIFIQTRKLYTGMGAHAGLVFVKVVLRRMPLLTFLAPDTIPFWVNKDLRMSHLVHVLFIFFMIYLIYNNKKQLKIGQNNRL